MDYSRQSVVFDRTKAGDAVHVVGCGATGSWVVQSLVRLGVPVIHVYDFDTIEEHNVPNQAFPVTMVGRNKAEALAELMKDVNPEVEVIAHDMKVEGRYPFSGIVFMLVDSMKARKDLYTLALKFNPLAKYLIETRMDAYIGLVYSLAPTDPKLAPKYEATLYTDEVATVSICGVAQSLAPTAAVLANLAVWQYIKYVMGGEHQPNEIMLDLKFNSLVDTIW